MTNDKDYMWTSFPAGMRCTQADRDAVAEVLSRNYAAGALDDEEFRSRLDKLAGAKTYRGLASLCADLHSDLPGSSSPVKVRTVMSAQNVQNLSAIVISFTATILVINVPAWDMLSILLCCFVNGLIGFRRNGYFAATGFISGLCLILGTCLMIFLTAVREEKVRAVKRGSPGHRDW